MIRLKIKIKKHIGTIVLISPLQLPTQPVAMSSKTRQCDHTPRVSKKQICKLTPKKGNLGAKNCFSKTQICKTNSFKNANFQNKKFQKRKIARQKVSKKTFARQKVSKITNLYDPPGRDGEWDLERLLPECGKSGHPRLWG